MLIEDYSEARAFYTDLLGKAIARKGDKYIKAMHREYGTTDLWYMLVFLLHKSYLADPFFFQLCRIVQKKPNEYIDLWSRGHGKSSIITFGLTIFDILNDSSRTFGIFSHDRKMSKSMARQMKTEFQTNMELKAAFPEIFYADPERQSPLWSLDEGLVLKRKGNPKEPTIGAYSLDALPTGMHFTNYVGDDLVTETSVTTPEQKEKTAYNYGLSTSLVSRDPVFRIAGTFYSHDDLYNDLLAKKIYKPRIIPATQDGTPTGTPVFWTPAQFKREWLSKGSEYIANCQLLLNPKLDDAAGFREEWWQTWSNSNHDNLNLYVVVDPAGSKKKTADKTAMWLIGYGADKNVYVVDAVIDKLNLTEKADVLFKWHRNYSILKTFYEKVALQTDKEHMHYRMEQENFRFKIEDISPKGRQKRQRIDALQPWLEEGRIFFPKQCFHVNYKGEKEDMIRSFKNNEYIPYPVLTHEDGLDALSYICDIDFVAPGQTKKKSASLRRIANSNNVVYGTFAGY